MTLQDWVTQHGGQRACAAKFKFSVSSLGAWCRSARYPTPASLQRLIQCSNNQIDFQDLLQAFVAKKNEATQAGEPVVRRLTGSVFVSDVSRLKRLFIELELPPERCNLFGEKITARWTHTHVTVSEVRSAVAKLANEGKDSGDLQLIHRTIAEARNAALGSLVQ
ncbi:hypothetical protein [Enterobacter ludwigii]|uniref:hypothetical protein n=1 Tax=Enterobacter ludwigii TaxID=299767 RepID=UPI0030767C84